MYTRLQYITDSPQLTEQACKAGVRWVQARIKNKDEKTWTQIAGDIAAICKTYDAICIINDSAEIALKINADGVHLGQKDMSFSEAKKIFRNKKMIIGGSANSAEDVIKLAQQKINYMGLGPLRFTSTKKDLKPVLTMGGYKIIMDAVIKSDLRVPPIYAIGGVIATDVHKLLWSGIDGVAVSSAISEAKDINQAVQEFHTALGEKELDHEVKR
ncbi:MAG TPA: thiamine phosphate synthase [Bacteroidia bacterium]|jgi:thiamine-phosphate diphosphorylase|nr:thiamine phosphate synthase [Bacteroidia bacterium]